MPVIKHYKGVCHVFVDAEADQQMAEEIVLNAKVQRPAVCNAMETLLVDARVAKGFLTRLAPRLADKKVQLRVDERTCEILPATSVRCRSSIAPGDGSGLFHRVQTITS